MVSRMKRLPVNPREDADVIRTGTFPDASEPPRPYVPVRCETCRFWIRKKYPAKYVKQWGEAQEGECIVSSKCFEFEDGTFSVTITGSQATCDKWEAA